MRHGCQAEVRQGWIQPPPPRPADGLRPIAGELNSCGVAHVILTHAGQNRLGWAPHHSKTMADELCSCDSGEWSLNHPAVSPRRMPGSRLVQISRRDVGAAEMCTPCQGRVELLMDDRDRRPPSTVRRNVGEGHEVEVAHACHVVAGSGGATDEEVSHPTVWTQSGCQLLDGQGNVHTPIVPSSSGECQRTSNA